MITKSIIIGVILVCLAAVAGKITGHGDGSGTVVQGTSGETSARPEPTPEQPIETPHDRALKSIQEAKTLSDAIGVTKPLMTDLGNDDPASAGSLLLAFWMSNHDFWSDLMAMPDTKRAEVMKDSDVTRGRRLCVSGTVIEIQRDRSVDFRVYVGTLMQGFGNFVRFVSVGSTEGITEDHWGRFCGITPGTQSYRNVSGGETHAVQIVGAFDLKALPPE